MDVARYETTLHRALGDERRVRIVRELQQAHGALDVSQLAERIGLHANTVRWHLGILAGAGLVRSHAEPRTIPGRPRIVYELEADAVPPRSGEYRLLATVLAGLVSRTPGGAAASEDAGEAWGHDLVARPEPRRKLGEKQAIGQVVALLTEHGFDARAKGRRIEMHRCPFHDLAETTPEGVCALHRGLITGALDELGQRLGVAELEIFPLPDLCVAHLAKRERCMVSA